MVINMKIFGRKNDESKINNLNEKVSDLEIQIQNLKEENENKEKKIKELEIQVKETTKKQKTLIDNVEYDEDISAIISNIKELNVLRKRVLNLLLKVIRDCCWTIALLRQQMK